MRDAFGEVALQTADGKDASWALLDGLGTTAAQAVGGSVAHLSTFDDWGNQSFDTIGWNSAANYTGETTDAGYGVNNYYSRSYDPTTGSWMSQDSWRGLLTEPQTTARYGYVTNSPSTFSDYLGYCGGGGGRVPMCPNPRSGHSQGTGPGAQMHSAPTAQMISRNDDLESVTWNGPSDDWAQDPSDDYEAIPVRHVQGFDEGFPGYLPAAPAIEGGFGTGVKGRPDGFDPLDQNSVIRAYPAKLPGTLGVLIPVFLLLGNYDEGWIHIQSGHGSEDWDLVWATLEAGESDQYPTESMMIMDVIGSTLLKPDHVYRKDNADSTVYESAFSYYDHRIEVKKTGNVCVIVGSRGQVVSAYFKEKGRKEC